MRFHTAPAVVASLVAGGAVAAGSGALIARRLTAPPSPRNFPIRIHGVSEETISLDRTDQTVQNGTYSVMLPGGDVVPVGRVEGVTAATVTRTIVASDIARLMGAQECSWTGVMWETSAAAGVAMDEVTFPTTVGGCPGWLSRTESSTWAIHVHGMGSSRAGTLRGVRVAERIGWRSLSVTYRNTAEGPKVGRRRSSLGKEELHDVQAAVEYAVAHGAERIVLFGWSMGALMCLQIAADPRWAGVVVGVVCDSPVLRWPTVIRANLQHSNIPGWVSSLAVPWVSTPLSRLIGLNGPVPLRQQDRVSHADDLQCPVLVMHGARDWSTPLGDVLELQQSRADVSVAVFDGGHTMCWNSDADRWESVLEEWAGSVAM